MQGPAASGQSNPLLALDGVSKAFGGLVAVRGVDLEVAEGEILGLIGPNGSGKTTLFNLVSGFYRPDAGRITLAGTDVTGWSPSRLCKSGVARTFQLVRPFPALTALENVAVGCVYGREAVGPKDLEPRAHGFLELVGLAGRAQAMASSLTLVDRKRLELARALATGPRLLLLDELLAGLNPSEMLTAVDLIRKIRDSGVTIILVEHLVMAVLGLSDRVVVLSAGEKIAEGAPTEVAADPRVIDAYLGTPDDD